jgi:NhaA family Na+:H+ antiporter
LKKHVNMLQEFSVPLIAGVVVALCWANLSPESYRHFNFTTLIGPLNFHFLSNELFMVFFFGIAAVEITQSCMPGGDLNPPRKAVNPLLATIGGVIGPVAVYLALNSLIGAPELRNGWGIPTATDIALAWLAARIIFGANHPAISFLLLLAIADDAIGLVIIAIFYSDPSLPVAPVWLLLTSAGMMLAWLLRRLRVRNYWPYHIAGGVPSWIGLHNAHLHPALALVFIIPFLPHLHRERKHLFEEDPQDVSTLARFEHEWKVVVDFGLFTFGLANAGVEFSAVAPVTWLVLLSLLVGKTLGIFGFGWLGERLGFPLPKGMGLRHLAVAGLIAGIGFTVALFMAGEAFTDQAVQGAAKMGAIFSVFIAVPAFVIARLMGIGKARE